MECGSSRPDFSNPVSALETGFFGSEKNPVSKAETGLNKSWALLSAVRAGVPEVERAIAHVAAADVTQPLLARLRAQLPAGEGQISIKQERGAARNAVDITKHGSSPRHSMELFCQRF